jgi:hypothetical protein
MESFASINEQRLYRLYRVCTDIQSDLEAVVKSRVSLCQMIVSAEADS